MRMGGDVYAFTHPPPFPLPLPRCACHPPTHTHACPRSQEERVRRRTAFYHARLGEVRDFFEERGIEVVSIDTSALSTEDMCEEV